MAIHLNISTQKDSMASNASLLIFNLINLNFFLFLSARKYCLGFRVSLSLIFTKLMTKLDQPSHPILSLGKLIGHQSYKTFESFIGLVRGLERP